MTNNELESKVLELEAKILELESECTSYRVSLEIIADGYCSDPTERVSSGERQAMDMASNVLNRFNR